MNLVCVAKKRRNIQRQCSSSAPKAKEPRPQSQGSFAITSQFGLLREAWQVLLSECHGLSAGTSVERAPIWPLPSDKHGLAALAGHVTDPPQIDRWRSDHGPHVPLRELPIVIAVYRLGDSNHGRSHLQRSDDRARSNPSKRRQRRKFRRGSELAQLVSLLHPGKRSGGCNERWGTQGAGDAGEEFPRPRRVAA